MLYAIGGGWGDEQPGAGKECVAVIRGTDIPKLRIGDHSSVPFRYESESKVRSRLLRVGDIVIEVSGGSAASGQHTGRALLVTGEILQSLGGKVIPASFCRLLRLDSKQVDPGFIVLQIESLHQSGEIAEFENQSTGIANFQFNRFVEEAHPIIKELDSQETIAEYISSFDRLTALNRRIDQTLEAIAQAIFKSWFVDFDPVRAKIAAIEQGQEPLRAAMRAISGKTDAELDQMPREQHDQLAAAAALFPDAMEESELGEIPKGWEASTIGEMVEIAGGATPDTKNESYWNPPEHFWTSPKDLSGAQSPVLLTTERRISSAGLSRIGSGLLPKGTLLMSSRAPIGYLAITQIPVAINQGYIAILPGGKLPPLYFLMWCQKNMDQIKGQANGSTFMEISKKAFRPMPVIYPGSDLTDSFVKAVTPLFEQLVARVKESSRLAEIRNAFLPRLLYGELIVPSDPSDEESQ
ncbi:restriction endonuclease subunit S [Luteimonas deserti]|uniref:Restriction endonuclease subunit S n=1 Tax=Luteimonas deserti TaxID=2752306 RepID=A0A7Z0QUG7_9GAMM|nr:restriction endonuclease subunit S [Luteimonas deserti]NYZ64259.1 restriction endonuclease subunit S [Luteimonas deserti]